MVRHDGPAALIGVGGLLWHLALSGMLLLVWRLTVRLGRAMRDDVGPILLFPVAALLLSAGGAFSCLGAIWSGSGTAWFACDLAGTVLGWYASWHSWGWLLGELRGQPGKEG